jgi:hypothetical protein
MSVLSAVSCSRGGNLENLFLREIFSDCTYSTARQTITLQTEKCNMVEPPKYKADIKRWKEMYNTMCGILGGAKSCIFLH